MFIEAKLIAIVYLENAQKHKGCSHLEIGGFFYILNI